MRLFKKNDIPQLDNETANKILENTFEANQQNPNTVPLDVLTAYSNYRRERFTLQRTVLIVMMTFFMLLPFLFIPPSFTLTSQTDGYLPNPIYGMEVDSFMLVERITASINGHNVPVYEVDSHMYSIEPTANGEMEVTVTLINRQALTKSITVDNVDSNTPMVMDSRMENGIIYLYIADEESGIDYDAIHGVTLGGQPVKPASVNSQEGFITFERQKESLNVFIPDLAGNELHIILTVE